MEPDKVYPSFETSADDIISSTETLLKTIQTLQDDIVKSVSPANATFANVILPILHQEHLNLCVLAPFTLLGMVSPDADLRAAGRRSSTMVQNADIEAAMRKDMAVLVEAVWEKHLNGSETLDPEEAWTLEKRRRTYKNTGASIEDPELKQKCRALNEEANEIAQEAKNVFGDDNTGVWLAREELDGVPESTLSKLQVNDEGKLKVTFQKNSYIAIMKYATWAETRKTLSFAREARFPENIERLERLVRLRRETSKILGFRSHAERKMVDRMANSVEEVVGQLGELRDGLRPIRDAEIARLVALKKEYIRTNVKGRISTAADEQENENLNHWDFSFYANLLKEKEYRVDTSRLGEYFEVEETLKGMLGIFEKLFEMRFCHVEIPKWQDDVKTFSVWNSDRNGGEFLGYLYLDLFARHGKQKGAFAGIVQPGFGTGSKAYPPSGTLVCSFGRPSERPTLLQHSELMTFFHELGHSIHRLVVKSKFYHYMARDFVEIPSILLENWVWLPEVLGSLSRHWAHLPQYQSLWKADHPGEELPDVKLPKSLAEDLAKTAMMNGARSILTQVRLALFDLTIHGREDVNLEKVWNDSRIDILGLPGIKGKGFAGFAHVFKGYDAGYYGYAFSEVHATDLWKSAFEANPMDAAVGMRYRRSVLQPGGSRPEKDSLREFLGREPNMEAHVKEIEQSAAKQKLV